MSQNPAGHRPQAPGDAQTAAAVLQVDPTADESVRAAGPKVIVGRSPGQLAWLRLKRDRTAFISGIVLLVAMVIGLSSPLIERITGISPTDQFTDQLTDFGA